MKKFIACFCLFCTFCTFLTFDVPCFSENPKEEPMMICGGWTVQKDLDADFLKTFEAAAAQVENYNLTPLACSTQVAAGLNYSFFCVARPKNAKERPSYAVLNVFQSLQNEIQVTQLRIIPFRGE